MTVRAPTTGETPAIRSLQALLTHADPELIDAALEGPFHCRVAVESGDIVGYAIALPGDETTVSELVVAPEHRREGHGRDLLDAVAAAADADRLVVTTPASDDDAVAFYRALDFEKEARLEGFYGDGDALRLVRRE
ncbi:GNAT family N-acetyltransferase [Natronomonas marina]|uniref:GNAT family N-acetyltransferase n=1 Tax=Natronomonas marina TaxID=2961939 RepID=UPI0020C9438D|nr:GNAT family N-acetyltransferase [Natronomonas marina]